MDTPELAFTYFPENYRWSHGLLIALNGAPWGGAEIGEVNRVGLRLRERLGDDRAWFEEWTRMAESVEKAGRELASQGRATSGASGMRQTWARWSSGSAAYVRQLASQSPWIMRTMRPIGVASRYACSHPSA